MANSYIIGREIWMNEGSESLFGEVEKEASPQKKVSN